VCFFLSENSKALFVRAGGENLQTFQANLCPVLEIFIPEFNPYTFQHDIALLKVGCNHQHMVQPAFSFINTEDCLIYGYGSESPDAPSHSSNVLRYGSVRSISYKECEEFLGRAVSPTAGTGQFCARGKPPKYSDSCYGTYFYLHHFIFILITKKLILNNCGRRQW
jgi:Trypsin